jgi:hypothetical protein
MIVSGAENAIPIKMIDIETKEVTIFKSIAYAVRTTGLTEYGIRQGLNPLKKARFVVNGRTVVFRVHKP